MSNIDNEIFTENTNLLAGTITIGHRMVAESINNYLKTIGYNVSAFPEEWKYYKNLAGEYHESDHDYISTINQDGSPYIKIKLGGLSGTYEVNFTKDLIHGEFSDPAISVAYRFGSRGYKNLVKKYPNCVELIRGILYPVDKEVAINADDGSILQFGGYIRENDKDNPGRSYFSKSEIHTVVNFDMLDRREIGIINELEVWIKNYFSRWLVKDYVFFNEFYLSSLFGLLHVVLPAKINVMRLSKIGTYEVNTYHVKQKLNSIGGLGRYVDIIPEEVYMWLYRNANYLDLCRNRKDILDELIENVLGPLRIPIDKHQLALNNFESSEVYQLIPKAEVLIYPMNSWRNKLVAKRGLMEKSLEKEIELAPDNHREFTYTVDKSLDLMSRANNSEFPTKLLESQWEVHIPENVITFEEYLISYWIYNSATNKIGGHIFIRDPKTNEAVPMTNEAGLYLAAWLYAKGFHDVELRKIPEFGSLLLPKSKSFTIKGQEPYPSIIDLSRLYKGQLSYSELLEIESKVEPKYRYYSSYDFFDDAKKLWKGLGEQYLRWSTEFNPYKRAYFKRVTADFYWRDITVKPTQYGRLYKEFFNSIGMDIVELGREDCQKLFYEVVKAATGNQEMTEDQYRKLHTALIDIIRHFTSYAVHFVHSTFVGITQVRNDPVVRSFIEEVFAEFLVDVELPTIYHDVGLCSTDSDCLIIDLNVPLTIINHKVPMVTNPEDLPVIEINNSFGKSYSDVRIKESYMNINLSPVISEINEVD